MSQHRRAVTRPAGISATQRHRLLIGAVGALGASGLILGGIGIPVSADDVNAVGRPYATVDVRDGCLSAEAGTSEADGSVTPHGSDDDTFEVAGQGTAKVTICGDDLGAPSPEDPGGSLPDDPGAVVLDELDDVLPDEPGGSLEGDLRAIVTAALEGDLPGGGDGSDPVELPDWLDGIVPDGGDGFPGDPGDGPWPNDPGDLPGGLVPDGFGIDAGDLLDRLGEIITGAGEGGGPGGNSGNGGNGGGAPATNTSTTGSGSLEVGGVDSELGDPAGVVPGGEIGDAPALAGTGASPGGTLPRTGGGLGAGALRLVALLGLGRGLVGLAKRR